MINEVLLAYGAQPQERLNQLNAALMSLQNQKNSSELAVLLSKEINELWQDEDFNSNLTIVRGRQVCHLTLELSSLIHIAARNQVGDVMRAYKDQTVLSDTRELYLNNLLMEKDNEIKRLHIDLFIQEQEQAF